MKGLISPRSAEAASSFGRDKAYKPVFREERRIIKRTVAEVSEAIVSMGRISSPCNPILKAVGTVDQKRIARSA